MQPLANCLWSSLTSRVLLCCAGAWFGAVAYQSWGAQDILWVTTLPWQYWHRSWALVLNSQEQSGPAFLVLIACGLILLILLRAIFRPLASVHPAEKQVPQASGFAAPWLEPSTGLGASRTSSNRSDGAEGGQLPHSPAMDAQRQSKAARSAPVSASASVWATDDNINELMKLIEERLD